MNWVTLLLKRPVNSLAVLSQPSAINAGEYNANQLPKCRPGAIQEENHQEEKAGEE